MQHRYLLGYDIGSSFVKAALVEADSRKTVCVTHSPSDAMPITAPKPGWAEQDPEMWWTHVCTATKELLRHSGADPKDIGSIGIAYQMHGLVCVDSDKRLVRSSIIWCDSRAVQTGEVAFDAIGHDRCMRSLLNAPGNFTASKLGWVKENEPEIFQRIDKFMLPGDFIAMKLTDEIITTPAGLSEGILWDYLENAPADHVLRYFQIGSNQLPVVVPVFSLQGELTSQAAAESGLRAGIPVTYRAGDQPNNALSLGVLEPGQVAASGGTSGVVYSVADNLLNDPLSRVNSFMHVNHSSASPRIGVLLCINGAGSQYTWIKQHVAGDGISYSEMEQQAVAVEIGSEGLTVLPFGNGAERMLGNKNPGGHILGIDFNRHRNAHLYRAALEGIAFGFVYGIEMINSLGMQTRSIRVGNDNLFQSSVFSQTISTITGSRIGLIATTGAAGAAKASGVATGVYGSISEAMDDIEVLKYYTPQKNKDAFIDGYGRWKQELNHKLNKE